MSAPSIPNLLSLRGRGNGRRGGGGGRFAGRSSSGAAHDTVIQGTDSDAAISRLSAVELGYMDDPFARYFAGAAGPVRRLPIINRGTYTRTMALDRLVDAFLRSNAGSATKQIVSLGAGTDTRCLRLFSAPATSAGLVYHEVDFPATTAAKLATVQAHPTLRRVFPDAQLLLPAAVAEGCPPVWASRPALGGEYFCHGIDLRELDGAAAGPDGGSGERAALQMHGLRNDVPTLVLSECCLCYLEPGAAQRVIGYFTRRIGCVGIALYEAIRPDDAFGRMMVANLAARHIRMPTLAAFREPLCQEERLVGAGFERARAVPMDRLWMGWVGEREKARVDALEGLDEVEEWNLLAGHYVVAWGSRGAGFEEWESSDMVV